MKLFTILTYPFLEILLLRSLLFLEKPYFIFYQFSSECVLWITVVPHYCQKKSLLLAIEENMETRPITLFSIYFFSFIYLRHFLFENSQNSFDKGHQLGHSIILFRKETLILKTHIKFAPPEESRITIFNGFWLLKFACKLIDFYLIPKF